MVNTQVIDNNGTHFKNASYGQSLYISSFIMKIVLSLENTFIFWENFEKKLTFKTLIIYYDKYTLHP